MKPAIYTAVLTAAMSATTGIHDAFSLAAFGCAIGVTTWLAVRG